ncbi:MAG: GMC family oxidoreductase [Bacteroidota bacterium]
MSNNTDHHYDAIVIGAGMSGSYAAKEFCDKGLKTLLLERGRDVKHITDYPTTNTKPWDFKYRGQLTFAEKEENPIVGKCYAFREDTTHFFAKDKDHPYIQEKPFDWIKGYQVGGRSIMWARQTQRWSQLDFDGPARDGFAVEWPISYADLAPWYSEVEKFVGISGNRDGLDMLPDGEFLKAWELNCVEKHFQAFLKENYKNRHLIYARCAHLTETNELFQKQGRSLCQNRTICERGCPYGGYFNANSTLIPWAQRTGNLTLRPHSVVHSIIYDKSTNQASGVRIVDANTKETTEYFAKVIFVNAGTLNSNLVLLNSKSDSFPEGIGNAHGLLGKYVAFHNYRGVVSATMEDYKDLAPDGRRPTSAYIPRFRNLYKQETDFLRGYAVSFGAGRGKRYESKGIGNDLFESINNSIEYGPWGVYARLMGETIPKETNKVTLDANQKDDWGIPLLRIDVDYDDNDEKMTIDFKEQMEEMLSNAGFTNFNFTDTKQAPGFDIHEMGGVRMGKDPKTSLLNKWNQMHLCKNVFVTDGACMTSVSTQNPSLTFMALTARAANRAVELLKDGAIG